MNHHFMRIPIPGYRELVLDTLLLDYNGTIALDGRISEGVRERLQALSEQFRIYVLTADTHGTARKECEGLHVNVHTFPVGNAAEYKREIIENLGGDHCVCMGNGRNDVGMFQKAALSIAVMDREGMYAGLLKEADLCVNSIEDGLDLLRYPKRLTADLRG